MKQLLTAEEFMYQNDILNPNRKITQAMIEFAKLHVEAALKEASNGLRQASGTFNSDYSSQKQSILNAYPLEQIK